MMVRLVCSVCMAGSFGGAVGVFVMAPVITEASVVVEYSTAMGNFAGECGWRPIHRRRSTCELELFVCLVSAGSCGAMIMAYYGFTGVSNSTFVLANVNASRNRAGTFECPSMHSLWGEACPLASHVVEAPVDEKTIVSMRPFFQWVLRAHDRWHQPEHNHAGTWRR
jgi:hypothetical protein